jgi:hypothetical protein
MDRIAASILIENNPAPDLFLALLEMEVEEDHRLATVFRIRLSIQLQDDGTWTYLDDSRLQPWAKVEIKASIDDNQTSLILGYVTNIDVHIDAEENNSYLEMRGMDRTCLMNLEEKVQDWPKKSDSQIASTIFSNNNLSAQVDDTGVVHDDKVSTIIQRETDIQFLKRLARRNGYECVVRGDTGYFVKPALSGQPQPVLAAYFGPDTNMDSFEARIVAARPAKVEMHEIDTIQKTVLDATGTQGKQSQLGKNGVTSFTPPGGATSKMMVRHAISTGQQEMEALCQAISDDAEWFVEANGELDTVVYGNILQTRKLVPIKGVGEMFSGMYYVTNVKHSFNLEHYVQRFKARRNATGPKSSDFSGGSFLSQLL